VKLLLAAFILFSASVGAATLSFEPYLTVWECPEKGIPHPILVCKEHTTNYGKVTVDFVQSTEDLDVAWWDVQTDGNLPIAYGHMSLIRYSREDGEKRMGLILSGGWNPDENFNSQAFLEGTQERFSDSLMLTSERTPYGDGELLMSFGFQNLKIQP
jgi:hypothetical protein